MNTQPIPITPENQPQFPCWLWSKVVRPYNGKPYGWEKHYAHPGLVLTDYFTHYHPDQPNPPACVPEEGLTAAGLISTAEEMTDAWSSKKPDPTPLHKAAMEAAKEVRECIQRLGVDYTTDDGIASLLLRHLSFVEKLVRERDEAREEFHHATELLAEAQSELATLRARLREKEALIDCFRVQEEGNIGEKHTLRAQLTAAQAKLAVAEEMAGALRQARNDTEAIQEWAKPSDTLHFDDGDILVVEWCCRAINQITAALAEWNAVNKEEGK